jgi:hypothetical protein
MRKILFVIGGLLFVIQLTAQVDYVSFLAREKKSYWAATYSLCHPQWDKIQEGMCFGKDSSFYRYEITNNNDTISLSTGYNQIRRRTIERCTYAINGDTIFITEWYVAPNKSNKHNEEAKYVADAYKILYVTEEKILLLRLRRFFRDEWWEELLYYPECSALNTIEFQLSE